MTFLGFRESTGSSWNSPDSGKVYLLCEFNIVNNTKEDLTVSSILSFEGYCDGYKLDYSFGAIMAANTQMDATLAPGRRLKAEMGFQVPRNWKTIEIEYTPDIWSRDKLVFEASK